MDVVVIIISVIFIFSSNAFSFMCCIELTGTSQNGKIDKVQ